MTNNSLVTIIIPVYNVEDYLIKCLESVSNQSYKNIEIIAVNDGSKDNSLDLLWKYKDIDDRLIIVDQSNKGLSGARNSAIEIATGEYIIFLDSDDFIKKELVEEVLKIIIKNDADIAVYGYDKINEKGQLIARPNFGENIFDHDESLSKILSLSLSPMACNKMYKKSLFIKNNIFYPLSKLHEDIGTTYKLFWNAKKIISTSKSYYYWIIRDGSITSKTTYKHVNDIFDLFHEKKVFLIKVNIFEKFRESYEIGFIKMINLLIERLSNQNCKKSNIVLKYLHLRAEEEKRNFIYKDTAFYKNMDKLLKNIKKDDNITKIKSKNIKKETKNIMNYKLKINTFNNYIHYYIDNLYLGMFVFDKGELSDSRAIIRKNRQVVNSSNLYKMIRISLFGLLNHYLSEKLFIEEKDELEKVKSNIVKINDNVLKESVDDIINNEKIKV